MSKRSRFIFYSLFASLLLLAAFTLSLTRAQANNALSVYVAKSGNCGGLGTPGSTCFATVQAGVDHLSNNGSLKIMPGNYAESIDLSRMGQQIGGAAGSMTIASVDSAGNPNSYSAVIVPSNGTAIYTSDRIVGDIAIDGIAISAQGGDDAINLNVIGNVTIENVLVTQAADDGINIDVNTPSGPQSVVIADSSVSNAGGDGIRVNMMTGTVHVIDTAVRNSGSDGVQIDAETAITLTNVTSEANGKSGALMRDADSLYVSGSSFNGNVDDGLDADDRLGDIRIVNSMANNNGDDGVDVRSKSDARVWTSTASGNVEQGFELAANDNIELYEVSARNNGKDGIAFYTYTNRINDIYVEGSLIRGNNTQRDPGGGIALFGQIKPLGTYQIRGNAICDNNVAGLYIDPSVAAAERIDAHSNWWGDVLGPFGVANRVSDGAQMVDYDRWVSLISAEPETTSAGSEAQLTFKMSNSNRSYYLTSGLGDPNGSAPFTITASHGELQKGSATGSSVAGWLSNSGASAMYRPNYAYDATITLTGPCGLSQTRTLAVTGYEGSAVSLRSVEAEQLTSNIALIVAAVLGIGLATLVVRRTLRPL